MLKSMSVKSKAITFIILALIAAGVLVKVGFDNGIFEGNKAIVKKDVENNSSAHELKSTENQNNSENTNKANNENKVDEKEKALDDKYNAAYQKFRDKSKSYEETIKDLDGIINEDANYFKAYTLKGISQVYLSSTYGNGDLYEKGMQSIDKALEINPNYGYGVFNKALAYELFAKYQDALEWYEKSIKLDNYIWSYYGAAKIYCRNRNQDKCIEYLKIAISKDNKVKEEIEKDKVFNNIRETEEYKNLMK